MNRSTTLAFAFATLAFHSTLSNAQEKTTETQAAAAARAQQIQSQNMVAPSSALSGYGIAPQPMEGNFMGTPSNNYRPNVDKLTRPKTLEEAEAMIYVLTQARITDKIIANAVCDKQKKGLISQFMKEHNQNIPTVGPAGGPPVPPAPNSPDPNHPGTYGKPEAPSAGAINTSQNPTLPQTSASKDDGNKAQAGIYTPGDAPPMTVRKGSN